jgi:hypothetical protein
MNIKLEKDEILDFFLLYIKDLDDLDERKESTKILRRTALKNKLNVFNNKINTNTLLKYNQFKSSLKDNIRILS